MARQEGPFYFTGKYKGVIGFKTKNGYFFKSIPEEVNQTPDTKKASEDFGSASSCSKVIRQALHGAMDLPQDSSLANRLNKMMAKVLRLDKIHTTGNKIVLPEHLSTLKAFAFNEETTIDNVLLGMQAIITQQDYISVSLPSIAKIKRTKNTTHIEIKAIAISANFARGTYKANTSEAVMINARQEFQPLELRMPNPGNGPAMVILQVRAFELVNGEYTLLENKRFCAADIIAVLPPLPALRIKANHKPNLKKIPAPVVHKQYFGLTPVPQKE
jgi:hypothetical protein